MKVEISSITYKDSIDVNNFLKGSKAMVTNRVLKELLEQIEKGLCFKMVKNGVLVAVSANIVFDTHVSFSFFKVSDEIKGRPLTLQFYKYVCDNLPDRPLILISKDVSAFKSFVEPITGVTNTYQLRRI